MKKKFYGGGSGASWLAEEDRLAFVTCPFPASGGYKKITRINQG